MSSTKSKKPTKAQLDLLAQLLGAGAAIQPTTPGTVHGLAAAVFTGDGGQDALRWCSWFPEDQSAVHTLPYDEVETKGRYVLLYRGGALVAGIGPYLEFDVDPAQWGPAWAEWQALLAVGDNQARFDNFFTTA